jgi:NitT/TauT family transport system permease protein
MSATTAAAVPAKPAVRRRRRFNSRKLAPWLVIIGIFAVWEIVVRGLQIPEFVLPAPSAIFASFWEWHGPIFQAAWDTLVVTVIGFAAAIVVGLLGGIALGSSRLVYEACYPALIGFNSIPKVAVVPILVIWFGIGAVPAVITAFLISFFPIMVNVATGIATVEPELIDLLRVMGARRRDIIIKIGLPRSMPYFFASLKIAITVAFVGSILSETIASNDGIGHLMLVASSRFQVPLSFAGLLVTSVMGVGMYAISAVIEQRLTGWATRTGGANVAQATG